jgi:small subunit ribosomal protein S21
MVDGISKVIRSLEHTQKEVSSVIKVAIRTGEHTEKFLQRFKRICSKEGVLREIKKRSYYEKPSDRRRRQAKERARAQRKRGRLSRAG